jgi:hypothetical protein
MGKLTYPEKNRLMDFDKNNKYYMENKIYNVELAPTNAPAFQLIDEVMLDDIGDRKKLRILEPGDKVIFKWK